MTADLGFSGYLNIHEIFENYPLWTGRAPVTVPSLLVKNLTIIPGDLRAHSNNRNGMAPDRLVPRF